jgi:hypothetical protein
VSVEVVVAVTDDNKKTSLAFLTAAALALPGISTSAAAADPQYFDLDSQFSRYSEGNNRMKIDVYQTNLYIPATDSLKFKINGVKDVITGASPVGNYLYNGKVRQIMSGASIKDVRDAVDLTGNYIYGTGNVSVNVGYSSENDYNSTFFSVDNRLDLNQKRTTLATGYSFSSDNVWAVDHCPPHCAITNNQTFNRPGVGGEKYTHQGLLGLTQIIDKESLVQSNITFTHSQGYLSDPYKAVYTPWVSTPYPDYDAWGYSHDTRPTTKDQVGLMLRYVRNFSALNSAALHLDYRFYADTWGVDAHTFEATWIQPIIMGWELSPRVRYYSQNSADFYQPYFTTPRADRHYSSDYRLAGFGAISGGAQLSKEFLSHVKLHFGIDFYQRQQSYGLNGGAGTAVDNFSFSMYSAGINIKF